MNDDEVKNVAGGKVDSLTVAFSVVTLGFLCAIKAIESERHNDDAGYCFTEEAIADQQK